MPDFKNEIVNAVSISLANKYEADQIDIISDAIISALADYTVTRTCTDIATYTDINGQLIKRYCACLMIDGKSEKTIDQYRRTIAKMANFLNMRLQDVGVYDLRLFFAHEKQRGISNRTLENTRANISAFYQWMTREDIIAKNPCVNVPSIKYVDKVREPFSAIEIDSLRSACKGKKERALIEVLLSTGMRVSELTGVLLSDVDFDTMSIHVRNGKGGKERTVYMSDLARKHLQAYLHERKELGGHLFYNKKHGQLNAGGVRHILNVIAERAGVDNVFPHRFRRTFATGMANRGMEVQEVSKLLGHSNLNTTMTYVYTSEEKIKASYNRFIA